MQGKTAQKGYGGTSKLVTKGFDKFQSDNPPHIERVYSPIKTSSELVFVHPHSDTTKRQSELEKHGRIEHRRSGPPSPQLHGKIRFGVEYVDTFF
jgi:hypothetical protein